MHYRGIIFDLDGTLLDTLADLGDSVNAVLAGYGHPAHSYGEYKLIIGRGFRDLLTRSLPPGSRDEKTIDEALGTFTSLYDTNYRRKTRPYDGIPALLRELENAGVQMAVNSNKRNDYSVNLINGCFPEVCFTGVFGEREGVAKKPDPQAALELAGMMELDPQSVIYIGDSKTDIQTGKNAGMGTGGVLWGFRGEEELREHGADHIFASPREIAALFGIR